MNSAQLQSLTLTPATIVGGAQIQGVARLSSPAVTSARVELSSDSTLLTLPAVLTVPAGQATAAFPIATVPVLAEKTATVTATFGRTAQSASVSESAVDPDGSRGTGDRRRHSG